MHYNAYWIVDTMQSIINSYKLLKVPVYCLVRVVSIIWFSISYFMIYHGITFHFLILMCSVLQYYCKSVKWIVIYFGLKVYFWAGDINILPVMYLSIFCSHKWRHLSSSDSWGRRGFQKVTQVTYNIRKSERVENSGFLGDVICERSYCYWL